MASDDSTTRERIERRLTHGRAIDHTPVEWVQLKDQYVAAGGDENWFYDEYQRLIG